MADGQYSSEDAALVALGNALLLNAFVAAERHRAFMRSLERNKTTPFPEDHDKARLLGTECRDLWEALDRVGALDPRIDGPIDITDPSPVEPLGAVAKRVNDLVNSDADIATLRLRDFPFPRWFQNWPGFRYALTTADPYELRAPLATVYASTKLVQALRAPVLVYFSESSLDISPIFARDPFQPPEESEPAEAEDEARSGGPRTGAEIAKEDRAKAALRALGAASPGRRMRKRDFCDALLAFISGPEGFTWRAAERVWEDAAPKDWKNAGKPRNDTVFLTAEDLEPHLRKELGRHTDDRSRVPDPPEGSGWGGLLKPRPWTGSVETAAEATAAEASGGVPSVSGGDPAEPRPAPSVEG